MSLKTPEHFPLSWIQITLATACTQITDGTHKTPKYQGDGVRFISIKNIRPFSPINWDSYIRFISQEEHELLTRRCKPEFDDILIPRIGTLGFAKRIDFEEPVSLFVGLGLLKPNKVVVRPKFLEYYMNAPWIVQLSRDLANGSGRMTLPLEQTREFPLFLAPLAEQDRIVDEIEKQFTRLDAATVALKRVQANLKRYRASVLKAACEGRLVPTEAELARQEGRDYEPADKLLQRILRERRARWEADTLAKMQATGKPPKDSHWKQKYREPSAPDTSNLPVLPEGWCWASILQLGGLDRGKSKHRPRNDPKLLGGPYPFIQTGDIKRADGFIREHSQTYSHFGLQQSRLWPTGTLCITIAANIAETGILTFPACFPDSVVGFSATNETVTRWVELFLRVAKEDLSRYAPATAQKNINLEILSGLIVPLPPLDEQKRMIDCLDEIHSAARMIESSCLQSMMRSARLRSAILKSAFTGQLVPQDPTDEPASVLLERIRAERITSARQKPARRGRKERAHA
jgi:type I restriction enzyme S subunit